MKGLLFTFLIVASYNLIGQDWQLQNKVKQMGIDQLTVDQVGFIYTTDFQGNVTKYASDGKLLVEFAPMQVARIHELVANSQFKVTLFYKDLQELVVLNRYLANPVRYRLSDLGLGYIEDVAPNFQPTLWVIDITDFSLKLIDLGEKRELERKSLAQVLDQNLADIIAFHSHQNRMYVVDRSSGIHVFDNIGNYLYNLSSATPLNINFDKDYLYFHKEGKIYFIHLYEGEDFEKSVETLSFKKMRYANDRLITITLEGFNIYK